MKTLKNILTVVLVATLFTACKNEAKPEVKTIETDVAIATKKALNPDANFVKTEFTIEGMTCAIGCARTIESKIAKMDGVKSAKVDFDRKLAMVEYDDAMVNHEALETTVSKTADIYKVSDMKDVDAFTAKTHDKDCQKECCKNKTAAESASTKAPADKKEACAKDCKKACCTEKKGDA